MEGGVMDIQNFIEEFKKTFVYDILSQTLSDEQLFEHVVDDDGVLWFKEQTRQMWSMWQAAKTKAVPDGYVVASTKDLNIIYDQINDWNTDWPLVFGLFNRILEARESTNKHCCS